MKNVLKEGGGISGFFRKEQKCVAKKNLAIFIQQYPWEMGTDSVGIMILTVRCSIL